jgi:hypothetical protein
MAKDSHLSEHDFSALDPTLLCTVTKVLLCGGTCIFCEHNMSGKGIEVKRGELKEGEGMSK